MLRFIRLRHILVRQLLNFNTSHVTVYRFRRLQKTWRNAISIHPMLRFINSVQQICWKSKLISIHPMLRFIPYFFTVDTFLSNISIHPMLRFINLAMRLYWWHSYFNTSHVTVYLSRFQICRPAHPHFNTSHVTVYPMRRQFLLGASSFQYIPCYGLSNNTPLIQRRYIISIHPMLRFIQA